ncbi:hypothetical protein GJ496_001825 [Pomphorhynchus laevis]|nr:hypothetical protein GJ496_001825 [Pomphorhynchus laevis]
MRIVTFHPLLESFQRSFDLVFSEIPATIIQNIQKPIIGYRNSGNLKWILQHMPPKTTEKKNHAVVETEDEQIAWP